MSERIHRSARAGPAGGLEHAFDLDVRGVARHDRDALQARTPERVLTLDVAAHPRALALLLAVLPADDAELGIQQVRLFRAGVRRDGG